MGGTCNAHGRNDKYIESIGQKAERKKQLGRPRCRWQDNIIKRIGWTGVISLWMGFNDKLL
jgi:hypothetical protein